MGLINYKNLYESILHYEKFFFERIESPWMITSDISNITRPHFATDYQIHRGLRTDKVLVASGEQSFLYLYNKGYLPKGKFQTITPCFRDEVISKTQFKYFMKNELIITDTVSTDQLDAVISICLSFFKTILNVKESELSVIKYSENTYDIMYENIELGSYGIRECEFLKWIFATGCAEPRLSYCQNLTIKD